MAGKLEVSFNSPQCGWMSIGLSDGVSEFNTTTAHAPHQAALPELLRTLTELLESTTSKSEYFLKWSRDPEEFDFRFVRDGYGEGLFEVYQYPTDEREASERELVFSHTGAVRDICEAFAETFERLYEDRETDEFDFNWRQPFPFLEYKDFQNAIQPVRHEDVANDPQIRQHLLETSE
ncbi:MAG: hypothetical protein ABR535_00330 [Pyrinomonadaceae bacterium]